MKEELIKHFKNKGKLYVFGNGGFASIAEHFVAELQTGMGIKFLPFLKAYSLTQPSSTITAISNDFGFENVFLYQLLGKVDSNSVVIGLSCSGSKNVLKALDYAKNFSDKVYFIGGVKTKFEGMVYNGSCNDIQDKAQIYLHQLAKDVISSVVVGFTNGVFDGLHVGHLYLLKEAKKRCDYLIVGINSDNSAKRLKKKLHFPLQERIKMLYYTGYVDYVIPFNEDTPYNLIKTIKPDVLFKGAEYKPSEVVGRDLVKEVILIPNYFNIHNSKVRLWY